MSQEQSPRQENKDAPQPPPENGGVTQPPQQTENQEKPFWKNETVRAAMINGVGFILGTALGAFILAPRPPTIPTSTEQTREQRPAPSPLPADPAAPHTGRSDKGEKKKTVIMIGSGTVYKYLTEHKLVEDHELAKDFSETESLYVPILEGPTKVGAQLFASAFENMPVLVMAAHRLPLTELQQQTLYPAGGASGSRPESVFEIYLGADQLHLFLVSGSKDHEARPVRIEFEDIFKASSDGAGLDYEKISGIRRWMDGKYSFYAGSPQSGTGGRWREVLLSRDGCDAWPSKYNLWDIQTSEDVKKHTEPRIYLGSEVLNLDLQRHLPTRIESKDIPIVHGGEDVVRGLYLYGYIDRSEKNEVGGDRYKLPQGVSEFLRLLFGRLEAAARNEKSPLRLIDAECIKEQKDYFNLNTPEGSVSVSPPEGGVYRPKFCKDRPEEK